MGGGLWILSLTGKRGTDDHGSLEEAGLLFSSITWMVVSVGVLPRDHISARMQGQPLESVGCFGRCFAGEPLGPALHVGVALTGAL